MGFREKIPTGQLCLVTLTVSLLIVVPAAYQNTVVDQPQDILMSFTNTSFYGQFHKALDVNGLNTLWGFMVCASGIAAIPCSLFLPAISDRFGCKSTLFIFASICNIICGALECASKYTGIFELFVIGQLFGPGFGWTFAFGLAPVYLAECSPPDKRGMTGTLVSFGFYVGILLSFIIGIYPLLGSVRGWGIYMVLTAAPAVLCIAIAALFPESPKHLYIKQENPDAAREVIKKFHGKKVKVEEIFKEYDDEASLTSIEFSLKELLRERHLRMPMIISVVAIIFTFTCGPMVTMSFSTSIFAQFLDPLTAQVATIIMASPLPILSILSSFAMERWGRRPLLLWGGVAMLVCLLDYVIFGAVANFTGLIWPSYIAVAGIVLNMWISPIGPLPIGMFLVSEITPQASRTASSAACVIFSMIVYVILSLAFPPLQERINYWAVLVLLIIPSTSCLIFLWLKLPETKDQPISKIIDNWITPVRKQTIAIERKMSMLQHGRKESLVAGKKVSIDEDLAAFADLHHIPLSHLQKGIMHPGRMVPSVETILEAEEDA